MVVELNSMDDTPEIVLTDNLEDSACFLSRIFFCFLRPLLSAGYKRTLKIEDFARVSSCDESSYLCDLLEKNWKEELERAKNQNRLPKLGRAIHASFWKEYWFYGTFFVFEELFRMLQLLLMSRLIRYFQFCTQTTLQDAYMYAFLFTICTFLIVPIRHPSFQKLLRISMQVRVALSAMIYKKSLNLHNNALRKIEAGKIVNLLSNDVGRCDQAMLFLHYFWVAPLVMVLYGIVAWQELGPASLAGFAGLLILIPIQGILGKKSGQYRMTIAQHSDKRINLMNEILNGVRVIKMYAWEEPFVKLVNHYRKLEIRELRIQSFFISVLYGLYYVNTKILITCVLVVAYFFERSGRIDSENVFVACALFSAARNPIGLFLPFAVQNLSEFRVTCRRIQEFLMLEDRNAKPVHAKINGTILAADRAVIRISHLSMKWVQENEQPVIKDFSLTVAPKELLMIVGPVGAGKSTILQLLSGEVGHIIQGSINVEGKIAYVPQEPWIFPASIRKNILFGSRNEFDAEKYKQSLEACSLNKDLASFPNHDMTHIGDKGASLSGGQKARIALARAVYFDAELYVMDDPLSAVDSAVGKWLFEKCIRDHLQDKTRILVTNQLQYLKYADRILVMKDGQIATSGTFDELMSLGDAFTAILAEAQESSSKGDESKPNKPRPLSDYAISEDDDEPVELGVVENEATNPSNILMEIRQIQKQVSVKDAVLSKNMQDEEKMATGALKWNVLATYFSAMGNGFVVFSILAFCILVQIFYNVSDWWLGVWTTKQDMSELASQMLTPNFTDINACASLNNSIAAIVATGNVEGIARANFDFYAYTFIASTAILIVLSIVRSLALKLLLTRSSIKLHHLMFKAVLHTSISFFDKNPVGRVLNRFSKDTGTMDEQLSFVLFDLLKGFLTIIGTVIMVGWLNPWILVMTAPLFCVFIYLRHYYIQSARDVKRLEALMKSPVYAHLGSTLNGLSCIRSMNAQSLVIEDFHRHQNLHTSVFYASLCLSRWLGIVLDILCSFYIMVVAFVNVWSSEDQNASNVGLSLFYATSLLAFLQWMVRQSAEMENHMVSVERIIEYCKLPDETSCEKHNGVLHQPDESWPAKGNIKFSNVRMKYPGHSNYVLKGLSFQIADGEKIGIVGRTGAGKSSILSALFRLTPVEGQIIIDGVDTKMLKLSELRRRICIIPQDPVLFVGTLRQNLDPFDEYDDDEMWNALELVELKKFFQDSDADLEWAVQEKGGNLSVGQRQLICLARALLRRNKIIVIDEATANVDLHTDMLIQKTIRSQFADCTVLTIAHRLNTVMDSSRILVMDNGQLAEMGPPLELLKVNDGHFTHLVAEAKAHKN